MGFFDSWNFSIDADFESQWLYPGNVVRGCVHIKVTQATKVRAVRLHIRGTESYRFSKSDGNNNNNRTYHGMQYVIDTTLTLAGAPTGDSEFMMPVGTWSYPVSYTLPINLPPSYEYNYGGDTAAMRYGVTAYVDIPWGKDAEKEFPFQVLSIIPIGQWQASMPMEIPQTVAVSCCCCCDKGTLAIKSRVARTILVMGHDPAYIRVEVSSQCKEPINAVSLKLVQTNITRDIFSGREDVNVRNTMTHTQPTNILPGTSAVVDLCFTIPRGILPSFAGFAVRSDYVLTVSFDIPYASDPEVSFPVVIVQAVDPSNTMPPLNFAAQRQGYAMVSQPVCYAYQPPPRQPLPTGYAPPYLPISGAPQFPGPAYQAPPPPPIWAPLPDSSWAAMTPNTYKAPVPYVAVALPPMAPPPPQPLMSGGAALPKGPY